LRKEEPNNDRDSLKSNEDYANYNIFEKISSMEEIDIAQKEFFSDRQQSKLKKGKMQSLKGFVESIGLKHVWGRIEIYLLDSKYGAAILSIKGFASLVSKTELQTILNDS
jgi:hypothetical protein